MDVQHAQTPAHRKRTIAPADLRPPVLLTLLLAAFAGGIMVSRLIWPVAPGDRVETLVDISPSAPTPIPPTLTPFPTPTPTLPDVGNALETLYIDIAPDDFALIEAKRAEALERWILLTSDADFVPAMVHLGSGDPLPAKARLKGDWADHLASDKWSFRIELRGDHYLDGMEVISIHDPSMRTYLNEWLFHQNIRAEGVLSVGYRFVRVVLNGEEKGIYALEEGFAKELVESQQRREGVIIRYAEDLIWTARAFYDDQVIPSGIGRFYIIDEFDSARVSASPVLRAQRTAAIGLLRGMWEGGMLASEVFDVETMAKFLALADLWSAPHGLIWHNVRYYYNPVTTRLEPIAFDSDPFSPELDFTQVGLPSQAFYGDPYLQAAYARELWRISEPGYVEALEAQFGAQFAAYFAAMEPEFGANVLAPPWDWLRQRQDLIRQRLSPVQMAYADVSEADGAPSSDPTLRIGNLMDLPVEVVGINVGDTFRPMGTALAVSGLATTDPPVLPPLSEDAISMPYATFSVPNLSLDTSLALVTRVWGLTQTITQPILLAYPPSLDSGVLPASPSLDAALAQHPYLRVAEGDRTLTIPPGTWPVEDDLILPEGYGLRLEAGTTLRFSPENFLLATGPLIFDGTADAPVVLEPDGKSWRGIVVLDADAPSFWLYTTVRGTDAISRAGWALTGGITFYRSPIRLDHSRILSTLAEDGLNVIDARFEFVDSEFADTRSDAFDGDFAQGLIERCVFRDIAADAIDVSGADVQVRDVRLLNVGDKGLSVGEASRLFGDGVFIKNADFGVVSKDLSHVAISGVTIEETRIAGLAVYTKKPAYGPASMVADGVVFVDVPVEQQTLVQTGSWLDMDGARIWGSDVDIDALYEKWQR